MGLEETRQTPRKVILTDFKSSHFLVVSEQNWVLMFSIPESISSPPRIVSDTKDEEIESGSLLQNTRCFQMSKGKECF